MATLPWFDRFRTNLEDGDSLLKVYDMTNFDAQDLSSSEWADVNAAVKGHTDMCNATLRNGADIPLVGLGTWKSEKGSTAAAVSAAIAAGYRHIDCASVYANEKEVGDALSQAFRTGLARNRLFITSKLWNTAHAPNRVQEACTKSLADLGLDYLDLYLIHWPVTGNIGATVQPPLQETWQAMGTLVQKGLVRAIGVSNFSTRKMMQVMENVTVPLSVCQVEMHPYWRNDKLLAWCTSRGIHVTAYAPLGSPDSAAMTGRSTPPVLQDPVVLDIALRQHRSPAQVLLRWALQRGVSVLPKSTNPERIEGNLDVFGWELSEQDMVRLSGLAPQARLVDGSRWWLHPRGPYITLADLWDD